MNDTPKLLILGASPFIVPLIRTAIFRGFHTIVCSYNPKDPGFEFANTKQYESIVDKDAIAKVCEQHQITGVVTAASDLATATMGYLNDRFNLKGIGENAVKAVSDKGSFAKLLEKMQLPHPKSTEIISDTQPTENKLKGVTYPVFMKPFAASGSRGVKRVENFAELCGHHGFCYGASSDRKGYVIQEAILDATEYGCECIVENGRVIFLELTHKLLNERNVPTGHFAPKEIDLAVKAQLTEQVQAICEMLSVENSPINIDVMIGKNQTPYIIDFSFRLGGNLLPEVMHMAFGTDPYNRIIDYATGSSKFQSLPNPAKGKVAGSLIFGMSERTTFTDKLEKEIRKELASAAAEIVFDKKHGEPIEIFDQGSNRFGHALIEGVNLSRYLSLRGAINDVCTSHLKKPHRTAQN